MKHIIFSVFEHSKIKDILFKKQNEKKLPFTKENEIFHFEVRLNRLIKSESFLFSFFFS